MSNFLKFYGFTYHPFGRKTPKEAVFRHGGFNEALSRLEFTVELESICGLISEPGCGKSLLLGDLSSSLQVGGHVVHYFSHSSVGPFGLVNVLARRMGVTPRRSRGETADASDAGLKTSQFHRFETLPVG